MSPIDSFVARANIVRMRLQIAVEQDGAATATLQRLLEAQIENLRAGEAGEDRAASRRSEEQ